MKASNVVKLPTALTTGSETGAIHALDPVRETSAPETAGTAQRAAAVSAAADLPIVSEVWDALIEQRVVMHYQPQYDMRTGETVAAEALIRLLDRDGELVYPDRFIDTVEQSDLIVPLGRAVIAQVCRDLAASRAAGIELQRISINLSASQLNLDTKLPGVVDQMVAFHGLRHDDLEFELTERQNLSPNCAGKAVLVELAERGARIVIDDFGIGYSSVMYLSELPISAFKLDRALISRLFEDRGIMQNVVESLLKLAKTLGVEVVAEGIETREQDEFLTRAGCPYAQGFGYAKPMGIEDLHDFMRESHSVNHSN